MRLFGILLLVLLTILPVEICAGDFSTLNLIGFSKDGKYLAFEEYGTQDGSGYPFSDFFFIDVAKNSFASKPIKTLIENEMSTEAKARARAKLAAAATLKRLKIVPGNTGEMLVSRMLTDTAGHMTTGFDAASMVIKLNFARRVWSTVVDGEYDLILTASEVVDKECEPFGQTVYKMDLSLKDYKTGTVKSLQKDTALPKGRGCPMYYGLQYIFAYNENIVAFVNVYTMGFEGPDMRYIAVTAKDVFETPR